MSAPVVEYDIALASTLDALVIVVNNYTRDGWRPQGGITHEHGDNNVIYYYQVLVREGDQ